MRGSISSPLKEELEQRQAELSKGSGGSASAPDSTSPPAGMTKYKYLAADGGPHIVLPSAAAATWHGASSQADVTNPNSDYGRACAATQNAQFAVISAGGAASAIVIQNPPMSATGTAPDGSIDVYDLQSFKTANLDALLDKASAMAPPAFVDSGKVLQLSAPDAFLMFAGDTPTSTAYGVIPIKISAGQYRILVGNYSNAGESVTVYRLTSKPN